MERPEKVEVGQRWECDGQQCTIVAAVYANSAECAEMRWDHYPGPNQTGICPRKEILETWTYLGGPQPSPEVPTALTYVRCGMCSWQSPMCDTMADGWSAFDAHTRDAHPTAPSTPLQGKDPVFGGPEHRILAAAPQGKPHDWSDPYCVRRELIVRDRPTHRLCVACGQEQDDGHGPANTATCTPIPGWRLANEARIRAHMDERDVVRGWKRETPVSAQARLPDGRFQSHLLGQGAIGVWSLRSRDGK